MRIFLLPTVLLALASAAHAAPYQPQQVSNEAKWVAHLDADALRKSSLVERAYRRALAIEPSLARRLDGLKAQLGVDLRTDLHGLTVYGKRIGKNEGVVLAHADMDQKGLLFRVQWAPGHRTVRHGDREIHTWIEAKGGKDERGVAAAFHSASLLVIAPTVDEVQAALEALDGRGAALAKDSPLAAAAPEGTVALARAMEPAGADLPFKSPLLTQSEAFSLAAGECKGEVFAEACLTTKNPETAGRVKSILDGLLAMAELQRPGDAGAIALLRKVKVQQDGLEARVGFRAAADEVWTQVEKDWKARGLQKSTPTAGTQE